MARTVLITGGTRGIGAAMSIAFKGRGYQVAATYHSDDAAAQAFHKQHGIGVYKWDVADYEACGRGVESVCKDLGAVDTLINNAGITQDAAFHKMTAEQWRRVMQTNIDSAFNMTHHVWAGMREAGFGRVLMITSINGQKGQFGQANYAASKAALIGLTKSLALEGAAKGITVNAIAPGYIATDMVKAVPEAVMAKIVGAIPAGRLGEAEEVAAAALYLADEKAAFITGATLAINGGQYMMG
ncbi:MAG: acetoacetyl-CoA reductase [Alphaproteobacteria bacterium GM202ARS2]|nr:acetoacetyl-CoA reductase [Alphaproteobacteria bacterium GM202ARS2]